MLIGMNLFFFFLVLKQVNAVARGNGTNSLVSVNRDNLGLKTNTLNCSGKISKCAICQ